MGSSPTFANPLPIQRGRGEVTGRNARFFCLFIAVGEQGGRYFGKYQGIFSHFQQFLGYFAHIQRYLRLYLAIFQGISLYRPTQSPCGKYCLRFAQLKNLQRLRRLINNQFASQTGTLYRSAFVGVGQDQMTPHPPNNITTSIYIQTSTVIQLQNYIYLKFAFAFAFGYD